MRAMARWPSERVSTAPNVNVRCSVGDHLHIGDILTCSGLQCLHWRRRVRGGRGSGTPRAKGEGSSLLNVITDENVLEENGP